MSDGTDWSSRSTLIYTDLFFSVTGVSNTKLTKIARSDVEALGTLLNETALLAVSRNDKRVVIYSTIPDRDLIVRTKMEMLIYSVCAGRVILAHYTPVHLDECLIRLGLPTEEEWPEIYLSEHPEREIVNALTRIKQHGYDILDDGNGIVGFAAPLFVDGHVEGCIGTYLPTERAKDRKMILEALLYYAGEINKKLKAVSEMPETRK